VAVLVIGSAQLFSDQLVLLYGGVMPAVLLLVFALVVAWWFPREVPRTKRARQVSIGSGVGLVLLGLVGVNHVGARGLLFHDARTFPRAFATYLGVLDLDGDEDFPPWFGGSDCDNFDYLASGWRVEIPGNGLDDNCRLGDASKAPIEGPPLAQDGARPPIFLITIDTVGSEHLDLYGYDRATMPALTDLAGRARWFRQAYAPSNQTYFSTMSTLSGQSPERMMAPEDGQDPRLLRFTTWLPHRLHRLGYHTVAFAPPLIELRKMKAEELRFDEIDWVARDFALLGRGTTSKSVVDAMLTRLESEPDERQIFYWAHFVDPHSVHEAPQVFPQEDSSDIWDSELAYVDKHLYRLFTALIEKYGDDVVIIVTSDHGEQFGERGFYGHAYSLFESMVRVPLVIFAPSLLEPAAVEGPISLTSIVPTVLAMLGQPPDPRFSSPALVEDTDDPVILYSPFYAESEQRMEVGIVVGQHKLIYNRVNSTSLLFDLAQDPAETDNLAASMPEKRAELEQLLFERLEAEPQ
jgi:hypothetical protein